MPPTSVVVTQIVEVQVTSEIQSTNLPAPTNAPPTDTPPPTSVPSLSVTNPQESDGYHLLVTGGPENYQGDIGGLMQGFYTVGDNNKFMVYVDIQGDVYIISFHDFVLRQAAPKLSNKEFTVFIKGDTPNFKLTLHNDPDNPGTYSLTIRELNYGGSTTINLNRRYTN